MNSNPTTSRENLNSIIQEKLNKLDKHTTLDDLQEINLYIEEMKKLQGMIDPIDVSELNRDIVDIIIEGCNLMSGLYTVLDHKLIEATGADWLKEDVQQYIEAARAMFGPEVLPLPILTVGEKANEVTCGQVL